MRIHVRTIDFPTDTAHDVEMKRELVNHIESFGFECKFFPGSIEVFANKQENILDLLKEVCKIF